MLGWQTLQRHYLNLRAPDGASRNFSWQRCRKRFLKKVGKVCVCCSSKKQIEVHHVLPRHIRPDLAVDMTNLIALCKGCHLRIGHLGSYFTYNATIKLVSFFVRKNSVLKQNKVT
jgi:5-methylcytosine-specific restriction endonuclease McrA